MQLIALVHIIRRACHARSRRFRIAMISVNSRGKYESVFSTLSLLGVCGASEKARFEGGTGLRSCLLATDIICGSRSCGEGGGGVVGLGLGGGGEVVVIWGEGESLEILSVVGFSSSLEISIRSIVIICLDCLS